MRLTNVDSWPTAWNRDNGGLPWDVHDTTLYFNVISINILIMNVAGNTENILIKFAKNIMLGQ